MDSSSPRKYWKILCLKNARWNGTADVASVPDERRSGKPPSGAGKTHFRNKLYSKLLISSKKLLALRNLLTKEELVEAKRCFESFFKNFDANGHKRPASLANFGFLATSTHVVVIRDINVKNQLANYNCLSIIWNKHFTSRCSSLKSGDKRCLQL